MRQHKGEKKNYTQFFIRNTTYRLLYKNVFLFITVWNELKQTKCDGTRRGVFTSNAYIYRTNVVH